MDFDLAQALDKSQLGEIIREKELKIDAPGMCQDITHYNYVVIFPLSVSLWSFVLLIDQLYFIIKFQCLKVEIIGVWVSGNLFPWVGLCLSRQGYWCLMKQLHQLIQLLIISSRRLFELSLRIVLYAQLHIVFQRLSTAI